MLNDFEFGTNVGNMFSACTKSGGDGDGDCDGDCDADGDVNGDGNGYDGMW